MNARANFVWRGGFGIGCALVVLLDHALQSLAISDNLVSSNEGFLDSSDQVSLNHSGLPSDNIPSFVLDGHESEEQKSARNEWRQLSAGGVAEDERRVLGELEGRIKRGEIQKERLEEEVRKAFTRFLNEEERKVEDAEKILRAAGFLQTVHASFRESSETSDSPSVQEELKKLWKEAKAAAGERVQSLRSRLLDLRGPFELWAEELKDDVKSTFQEAKGKLGGLKDRLKQKLSRVFGSGKGSTSSETGTRAEGGEDMASGEVSQQPPGESESREESKGQQFGNEQGNAKEGQSNRERELKERLFKGGLHMPPHGFDDKKGGEGGRERGWTGDGSAGIPGSPGNTEVGSAVSSHDSHAAESKTAFEQESTREEAKFSDMIGCSEGLKSTSTCGGKALNHPVGEANASSAVQLGGEGKLSLGCPECKGAAATSSSGEKQTATEEAVVGDNDA